MNTPTPHCTTHDEVLAFEAHATAHAAKVGAEVVFTSAPMGDGRVRHTATHPAFPADIAHDYLPVNANQTEVRRLRQDLARRWSAMARTRIDTPEAAAARERIKKAHAKAEQDRKAAEAKDAAIARAAEARERIGQAISGPGIVEAG